MTTVKETIMKRCSTRAYKPDALPEDMVKDLIIAGLQAPTATNRQEVHISVVKTTNPALQEIDDDIAKAMKEIQKIAIDRQIYAMQINIDDLKYHIL